MSSDMFLKLTDMDGESLDHEHDKEIDVLAWSWGMSQSGTTHLGPGAGSGKVSVQDVSVTKYVDSASHSLVQCCMTGKHFGEGLFAACHQRTAHDRLRNRCVAATGRRRVD